MPQNSEDRPLARGLGRAAGRAAPGVRLVVGAALVDRGRALRLPVVASLVTDLDKPLRSFRALAALLAAAILRRRNAVYRRIHEHETNDADGDGVITESEMEAGDPLGSN